ncbi:MAG TPA: iron-containing alcohol dehydrogenase [Terriglobales bacterium]|nr:iron-containing alcohol dehydrogenase [Terriglobales bacterium]
MTMGHKEPTEAGGPVDAGADATVPAAWPRFSIARLPRIMFGIGTSGELPTVVREFGQKALVVVRGPGFTDSTDWARIRAGLESAGVEVALESVSGEPSPTLVDGIVARRRASSPASGPAPFDVVVGVGGGSVLDTAKAVAGLLIPGNSVMDHLEGIGPELPYRGPSVPFIAVPTTAGTGSEATKNAVLSVRGVGGFKKSFRDETLVARVAIVDPDLLGACPPELIAGNGMDALTQLLESYVSTKANPFTDALALSGLAATRDGLGTWFEEAVAGRGAEGAGRGAAGPGSAAAAARGRMAYAALCSGICLAQAGLGSVHGLASPLGAQFAIPHGVACGATLVAATRVNITALEARDQGNRALGRYAVAGRLFTSRADIDDREARSFLVSALGSLTARLGVPRLSAFGITESSIPALVADSRGSSMKTNPIVLTDEEIGAILRASL